MKLALIGKNGSGKSLICKYLSEKGFSIVSLSDYVREEAAKRGLNLDRDSLTQTGTSLKSEFGLDILARRALEKTARISNVGYDSVRHPKEAETLKQHNVLLIGVEVPLRIRYDRIKSRQNETDFIDFDTFKKQDEYESSGDSKGQAINETLKQCDIVIQNEGTIDELYDKIEGILASHKDSVCQS